ncbi:non-specific lethal 1 isoform X2 [Lycorma delicatula]|uniref:non-specific lethal 1 isoform X2 n=1 Tax=Lycorma delicatula TaxID=130591 RepID=UPI003F5141A1
MGPRFASLRHPNVVMAPALTDARQTQKLRLTPTTIPPETTVSTFKLSNGKHFNKVIQCKKVLLQTQNTICNLPVKHFASTSVKTSDNKVYLRISPTKSINADISNGSLKPKISKESQVIDNKIEEASDYLLANSGSGLIMNNSGTPMGDLDGNMGLTKSETESLNYLKEKGCCSTDVDQLFKNFQNVDEILQVIKSMESNGADGENEMVPMDPGPSSETEGMNSIFPISDGSELPSGLANFDRELFTDVDVMNMCVDENLGENNLMINKETFIKDKVEEIEKKQYYTERKLQRLLRRLHKMQARTIGKHACEEVTGFLEHLNQTVNVTDSASSNSASVKHPHASVGCDGNCEKDCKRKAVNNISVLIRRLEQASQQQALAAHRHTKSCRYFGSGSRDYSNLIGSANGLKNFPLAGAIVPKLSENVRSEVEDVMGQLHTQLKVVENGVDSDVTASSSGGESCDEMQSSSSNIHLQTQQPQQHLSISKRAIWRWAHDRAEVASKWAWLQAQVSDLEYRIRQHTEFHRQIRTAKGSVVLQGEDPVVVNGYHGADSATTATSSSRTRPLVRSLFGKRKLLQTEGLHIVYKKAARPATLRCGCRPPDPPCALCTGRSDPTHPRDHPDLLTVNERIALLDPAFHPVLSFPNDVSQSIHFEALMRNPEWQQKAMRSSIKLLRVMESSLSDRSSSSDVLSDGSRRLPSSNRRLIMTGVAGSGDNLASMSQATSIHKKYNTTGIRKSTANSLSDKIKRLARGRRVKGIKDSNNHSLDRLNARKRIVRHSTHLSTDGSIGSISMDDTTGSCVSGHLLGGHHIDGGYSSYDHHHDHDTNSSRPSPVPSPTPLSSGSKEHTRRKRENSYDIDNIVIPYSVASATRLEKLQYKEILTPKWRILPVEPICVNKLDTKNNGVVRRSSSHDSDIEDISEETLISRHDKCEQEERKKFSTYLKLPNSFGRTRGHRRADSRAESSGANTPDPMSPVTTENLKEGGSPITSPPATPLAAVSEIDGNDMPLQNMQATVIRHGPGRRRTISLSQAQTRLTCQATRCEKDDTRPNTPVDFPPEVVLPYEPRTFPLSDEVYEKMLNAMPPGHPCSSTPSSSIMPAPCEQVDNTGGNITARNCTSSSTTTVEERGLTSRPSTPLSDSTESAIEEDPNDPEWTVNTSSTLDRSLNSKR